MKHVIQFILILFFFTQCTIFKGGNKPVKLKIRYDKSAYVNYGYSFKVDSYLVYSNEKEKLITGKEELTVTCQGAQYSNGRIFIDGYPTKLQNDVIKLKSTYQKDEMNFSDSVEIPFNYKGDLEINFTGSYGNQGSKGSSGGTALLFRDGKEGGEGGIGYDGKHGNDLNVHVWKDSVTYFYIKVHNITTDKKYIYKTMNTGFPIRFNVNGGAGGKGGTGGDGGDGKDGSIANGKTKLPGNGGIGGPGGTGGTGGNGGNVYVFVHPNAEEIASHIACYNFGGNGGQGGDGGKGGKGGRAAEGQTAGTDGNTGARGNNGYNGYSGQIFTVLVEQFDIEY